MLQNLLASVADVVNCRITTRASVFPSKTFFSFVETKFLFITFITFPYLSGCVENIHPGECKRDTGGREHDPETPKLCFVLQP